MPYKDKEAQKAYWRSWYRGHAQTIRTRVIARRKALKQWFSVIKENYVCALCGENCPSCIEFHHYASPKHIEVGTMTTNGYSQKNILSEINTCTPLCVNCHRKIHHAIQK